MDNKQAIEYIDTTKIKTKRELAMYIIGICSNKEYSDGICLDFILDACYKTLGTIEG